MPDFTLEPSSGLGLPAVSAAVAADSLPGVTLAERAVSLCSVLARKGAQAALADRVRQAFDITLPREPRYTRQASVAFAWAGPNQWLALGEGIDDRAFELQLRSSLAGVASVIDQSDGRALVRVSGPRAREALGKGVLLDLHPSAFGPGSAAATAVAYIGVHFWQVDAAPTYEFAMFRSFAAAFCEWLLHASAEFGVVVEPKLSKLKPAEGDSGRSHRL